MVALETVATIVGFGSFGLQIWDKLRQFKTDRRAALQREQAAEQDQKAVREIRKRLFGTWEEDNQIVFPSQTLAHLRPPLKGIYPQDGEALWELAAAYEAKSVPSWTDTIPTPDHGRNVCSIGSPASNVAARVAMGFRPELGRLCEGPTSDLRLNFDYSHLDDPPIYRYERAEAGAGCMLWDAKRYAIRDREQEYGDRGLLLPDISQDRFLRTDFLLVSVLPPLDQDTASPDARHVILAGAHSGGTKVAGRVLSDLELLRAMDRGRKQSRSFQSLFRVPVDAGNESRSARPLGAEHILTIPVR